LQRCKPFLFVAGLLHNAQSAGQCWKKHSFLPFSLPKKDGCILGSDPASNPLQIDTPGRCLLFQNDLQMA